MGKVKSRVVYIDEKTTVRKLTSKHPKVAYIVNSNWTDICKVRSIKGANYLELGLDSRTWEDVRLELGIKGTSVLIAIDTPNNVACSLFERKVKLDTIRSKNGEDKGINT